MPEFIISLDKIFDSIKQIETIDELDMLDEALSERRRELRAVQGPRDINDAMPGDTIEFTEGISPRYMIGRTATVKKVNAKSVVVACPDDPAYGRFRGKRQVRCPKSIVKLV